MFEQIISGTHGGPGRGSSMLVSALVHGLFVAVAFAFTYYRGHAPKTEEPVMVTFRAPPPPPLPLVGHKPRTPRQAPKRPAAPRLQPFALLQPTRMPKPEKPPDLPEQDDADEDAEGGVEAGMAGGAVGGAALGQPGGQGEGPPVLLGAGMTRPLPGPECRPAKPPTPEQARQMGITGLVLVEYTVHGDGHVDNVALKNPNAPPILFEAVKTWLQNCPFTPSIAGGRPVAVKMIQPFHFSQQ